MKDSEVSMNGRSGDTLTLRYEVLIDGRWPKFGSFEVPKWHPEMRLDRVSIEVGRRRGKPLVVNTCQPLIEELPNCQMCRWDKPGPHLHLKFGEKVVGSLTGTLTTHMPYDFLGVPIGIEGDDDSVVSPARTLPDLDVSSHDDENITT